MLRGDLSLSTTHAVQSLQLAEATRSRKHMAWAHKLLGDIAVSEERLGEARQAFAAALGILRHHPCPTIEWKILKAAADSAKRQKDDAASDELRGRALAVVQSLARSIRDEKLCEQFLAAKAVREL